MGPTDWVTGTEIEGVGTNWAREIPHRGPGVTACVRHHRECVLSDTPIDRLPQETRKLTNVSDGNGPVTSVDHGLLVEDA